MKIILVRHGETDENVARRYLGHFDAQLNNNGRQQLRHFIVKLQDVVHEKITYLYSSDLLRAMESAQIIGEELKLTPIPVFSLRELDFGDWDCKTYEAIWRQERELLEKWIENPFEIAPPNGQTLEQLGKQLDDWFQHTLLSINDNENIVIVTHGGPIRWLLSKWVKGDIREFWNVEGIQPGRGIVVECNKQMGIYTIINRLTWD